MVNSIDLVVVGGPSTISLDVDLGAKGIRGNAIYPLDGDPRTVSTDHLDILEGDLVINTDPSSVYEEEDISTYGWMFKLIGGVWEPIIDLVGVNNLESSESS